MTNDPHALSIRELAATELSRPIEWAAAEGWNPGLYDDGPFSAADTGGFLVGELASGEPVSVISAVRTGADFGFIGFYITAPEYRGFGYGSQVWAAALKRLDGRTIGLDGVVAQQGNYTKSGFVLAHRNLRYGGFAPAASAADGAAGAPAESGVVDASSVSFSELAAYDASHFGRLRAAFLKAWIAPPLGRARVLLRDGRIAGFGVIRRCRIGCKIGPLFAADERGADELFVELAGYAPGEPLFIDPPEPNGAAVALAVRHGLAPVFETARMYRGAAPVLPLGSIYGITSFELG